MASADEFSSVAGKLGIGNGGTIIVYDSPNQHTGLVAWAFLYYGHKDVRLLGMKLKERHAGEARKMEIGLIGWRRSERAVSGIDPRQERESAAQVTPANIHIGIDTSELRKLCAILEKDGVTSFARSNSGPTVWASAHGSAIRTVTSSSWPNAIRAFNCCAASAA